ncbi:MAG: MFS transporter [bacterium]
MKQLKSEHIPPTVIALGLVSFFTDLSSEMIYPLLPVFLASVLGAGAFSLGLIEGVAEATAAILKIVSGYLTDRSGKKKPFILAGYSLSSSVRPLIGLATAWPVVLVLRFMDRVGKGIRTSPRDTLIAEVTESGFRGRAYGFHRAMDHAGAVFGPLAAVLLLKGFGLSLRWVFLLSAFPAVMVIVIILFFVREKETDPGGASPQKGPVKGETDQRAALGSGFRLFLLAVITFTLGNSTDAFLLLRLNMAGVGAAGAAVLWAIFHVVKMASTYAGGRLSDSLGRKSMIIAGWAYYAGIYLLFAYLQGRMALITVFLLYGLYFGLTEPAERALVASFAPQALRGKAFGYYHGAIGLASLPSSLIFGLIWQRWGYQYAFIMGAGFALLGCALVQAAASARAAG